MRFQTQTGGAITSAVLKTEQELMWPVKYGYESSAVAKSKLGSFDLERGITTLVKMPRSPLISFMVLPKIALLDAKQVAVQLYKLNIKECLSELKKIKQEHLLASQNLGKVEAVKIRMLALSMGIRLRLMANNVCCIVLSYYQARYETFNMADQVVVLDIIKDKLATLLSPEQVKLLKSIVEKSRKFSTSDKDVGLPDVASFLEDLTEFTKLFDLSLGVKCYFN